MAHQHMQAWIEWLREQKPTFFTNVDVLDCGSLDINGNNLRFFDPACRYLGVDLVKGPNVDWVGRIHDLPSHTQFDVVCSTEMLEHDEHYQASLRKMVSLLRPGGLLFFTCATTGRPEHGTSATTPTDSPATLDYYRTLEVEDISAIPNFLTQFSEFRFFIEESHCDLYFYGIKKLSGGDNS